MYRRASIPFGTERLGYEKPEGGFEAGNNQFRDWLPNLMSSVDPHVYSEAVEARLIGDI